MTQIKVRGGAVAIVDPIDAPLADIEGWRLMHGYAVRTGLHGEVIYLHREVARRMCKGLSPNASVGMSSGGRLDCRRQNIKITSVRLVTEWANDEMRGRWPQCLVSPDDWVYLNNQTWRRRHDGPTVNIHGRSLHAVVAMRMGLKGKRIKFRSGNHLDCRRENLYV
jgi:hypothetical protein